ncbi:hypothetical protein [Pengzhenrongella sp.]|uniref:hypothetical protein n=1 Tax=Pengzhenrongella sp. TaxID=2888820 RepID=UPI002F93991C
MTLTWRDADVVELRDGYAITDSDGRPAARLTEVRVAVEGGFLHIHLPGANTVEIVSAPALGRLTYRLPRTG